MPDSEPAVPALPGAVHQTLPRPEAAGHDTEDDDGLACPNGNRPPECTEIDPCEPCAQDEDAEAEQIEASMGLRNRTNNGACPDPAATYEVIVFRTEMITFSLPAASVQDAEERYLMDGDETGADTVALRVDSIKRLDQEQTRT
jgi:hypothetical protein